jgi:hypothetical protein
MVARNVLAAQRLVACPARFLRDTRRVRRPYGRQWAGRDNAALPELA